MAAHIIDGKALSKQLRVGFRERLNDEPGVHGMLVPLPLPLPAHIAMARVLAAMSVHKDVDGVHLYNAVVVGASNSRAAWAL